MKTKITILTSFVCLAHVHAAPPLTFGQIVAVSGNITGISPGTGSFSAGSGNTFYVSNTSVLMINGKRGGMSDLANGMKVSGSAEVAKAEDRFGPPKQIVRMLTATTDPAYSPTKAAATPSAMPYQYPPGMPSPAGRASQGEMEALTKKLSGTFWTIPNRRGPNGASASQWLILNADGTITDVENEKAGAWNVIAGLTIRVQYSAGQSSVPIQVGFNAELNQGIDLRFGPHAAVLSGRPMRNSEAFMWTRIASPTPEMLSKAPRRPASVADLAAVPIPVPPSAETQQAASELVKTNHNNLVFVSGKGGAGSGFIANLDGSNVLVTNCHVAAGISDAAFKKLDGTVIPRGSAGVATGHDIFRMALPPGGKSFEVMQGVEQNAAIGDEVVVLGNAEGSGVINTIIGKIVGIGPNLVEIDAPFVPGNSGSPIIHLKTGKVIGVATYTVTRKYDATTKEKMKDPIIRRFGFRIDSVNTWEPVNVQTFYAQAAAMERVHTLTEALDNFFGDLYENKSRVTMSRHTHPVIKTRIAQWQEAKSHKLSASDRENADANFISFLKVACQSDITEVQRSLTYDYFQRHLADEQTTRNEMAKAFTAIIRDIRE